MTTRFGVRGGVQLAAAFRGLAQRPGVGVRRQAREAAAAVVGQAYAQNLEQNDSKVTGALIASIGVGNAAGRRNRTLVGAREGEFLGRKPSAYSHLVEYGTAPHYQPRRFGGIMHPGARPKPALRPALERSVSPAALAYFRVIAADIEAAAQRLASRSTSR